MKAESYNGWPNRETWVVALWQAQDESACRYWSLRASELLRKHAGRVLDAQADLGAEIEERVREARPDDGPGMFNDLISAALARVEWAHIAGPFVESASGKKAVAHDHD